MKKTFLLTFLLLPFCLFALSSEDVTDEAISFRAKTRSSSRFRTHFQSAHMDGRKLIITLDDGSEWCVHYANEDIALTRLESKWSSEDEVRLKEGEDAYKDFLVLKNRTNNQCYLVDYYGYVDSPKACFISNIDKDGYVLVSQDGSYWAIGYFDTFSSYRWHVGDRLTINKGSYSRKTNYEIINLDEKNSVWGGLVRWRGE